MADYAVFKKAVYVYYTGKQGKRKNIELKYYCDNCHHVWDRQAYSFKYCPGCGLPVWEIEEEDDGKGKDDREF